EDFATAKSMIASYKQIREAVQHGSLYRLVSPRDGSEFSITESVAPDRKQAVLFTFLHSSQMGYPFPHVYLRGLDPQREYRFASISGAASSDTPAAASGSYWMSHGVDVEMRGDLQAAAFKLEAAN